MLLSGAKGICPSQRITRKNQKSRLETLSSADVVVESLYHGTKRGYYMYVSIS